MLALVNSSSALLQGLVFLLVLSLFLGPGHAGSVCDSE